MFSFLKSFFKSPEIRYDEITVEFLLAQKTRLGMAEYKKWLRRKEVEIASFTMELEGRKTLIPSSLQEKLSLIKREREAAERYG